MRIDKKSLAETHPEIAQQWHSSLNVSLTYLRGLEVAELEENDMPMIL